MQTGRLKPRQQGDLGEVSALEWLVGQGATVYVPFNSAPDVDLIAEFGDKFVRVQVKTTGVYRNDRWEVSICTMGGNQSWNGLVKSFSPDRCDRLFVLVADGRRWWIPSSVIDGGRKLSVGGPKYAEYEIESGRPFALLAAA
jgi:hypothetical protein